MNRRKRKHNYISGRKTTVINFYRNIQIGNLFIYIQIPFSRLMKNMHRPGIKSRNFDLQGQCFLSEKTGCQPRQLNGKALTLQVKIPGYKQHLHVLQMQNTKFRISAPIYFGVRQRPKAKNVFFRIQETLNRANSSNSPFPKFHPKTILSQPYKYKRK